MQRVGGICMGKLRRRAVVLLVTALSLFVIAACGDDDDDGGGGGGGETGGTITVATVGPDNADPVLFQTVQAVQVFQLAYTPLVMYAHEEGKAGTEIVPGLATDAP